MTGVPDIEELSAPDPDDWVSEEHPGGKLDSVIFAAGASLILVFTMINMYALPLGTVSPQSVYDNAEAIYGSQVEVFGIITHSNEHEFALSQENSTAVLEVVWLGGQNLPLNGTSVVATGQIIEGTAGPAMMCDSLSVQIGTYTYYDNPWALPALRMLSTIMIWFVVMVFSTGIMASLHLHKRTEGEKHRIIALTDICTVSGGILTGATVALLLSEQKLGSSPGLFTFCAAAAFAFLLISSLARSSRRTNVSELANPLPIIAAITVLLGLLISIISAQLGPEVSVLSEVVKHLPDFAIAAAIGTSGLILIGIYIARRRAELSAAEGAQLAEEGA